MRIVTGGISHETSTFAPTPTTLREFETGLGLFRGPAVIERFQQVFPGIKVDHLAESSASVWLSRVRQERRAGTYSFDLALVQPDAALTGGRPEGMWAPIRTLLMRPDVLDDAAWRDGLDARFLDTVEFPRVRGSGPHLVL